MIVLDMAHKPSKEHADFGDDGEIEVQSFAIGASCGTCGQEATIRLFCWNGDSLDGCDATCSKCGETNWIVLIAERDKGRRN